MLTEHDQVLILNIDNSLNQVYRYFRAKRTK